MMRRGHRLRVLQVSEARHHHLLMRLRAVEQCCLQSAQAGIYVIAGSAQIEAEVGRHLVVAAARGVQFAGQRAQALAERRLDRE